MSLSLPLSDTPISSSQSDDTRGLTKCCFSGAVRRLLCTGSLPTDQTPEMSTLELKKTTPCNDDSVEVGASPGIVARLMGLDSLPDSNRPPRAAPAAPNSITRSMSLNFMDYFPEIDRAHGVVQHRRVRTSVSFREVCTSLHQQNRDCFVLFLENIVDDAGEMGGRMRKSEMGLGDCLKQKKINIKDSSKEKALLKKINEPKRVSGKLSSKVGTCYGTEEKSCSVLPQKKKKKKKKKMMMDVPAATSKGKNPAREASIGSKFAKKNQVDPQHCDSQNPSPVSFMDHTADSPVHHATPPGGNSRKTGSKRKKTWRKSAEWDYPAPNLVRKSNSTNNQEQGTTKKRDKQADKEYCYTQIFSKICRLTEADMKAEWTQWEASKTEDFEEMCREFEQQILNVVLHQVVVNELA